MKETADLVTKAPAAPASIELIEDVMADDAALLEPAGNGVAVGTDAGGDSR